MALPQRKAAVDHRPAEHLHLVGPQQVREEEEEVEVGQEVDEGPPARAGLGELRLHGRLRGELVRAVELVWLLWLLRRVACGDWDWDWGDKPQGMHAFMQASKRASKQQAG